MARITQAEAQAWAEGTKFTVPDITQPAQSELLAHIEEEVLARVGVVVDTTGWTTSGNTPKLVRTAISKLFVSFLYDRQYSEDVEDGNAWAARLATNAEMLITGIVDGTIEIPGITNDAGQPAFYPTDISSAREPTAEDPSLGPAKFSMGMIF